MRPWGFKYGSARKVPHALTQNPTGSRAHHRVPYRKTSEVPVGFLFCRAVLSLQRGLVFRVRIHDFNFRFGQALILLIAAAVMAPLVRASRKDWLKIEPYFQ